MTSQNSTVRCAASIQYSHAACHGANGSENGSIASAPMGACARQLARLAAKRCLSRSVTILRADTWTNVSLQADAPRLTWSRPNRAGGAAKRRFLLADTCRRGGVDEAAPLCSPTLRHGVGLVAVDRGGPDSGPADRSDGDPTARFAGRTRRFVGLAHRS